MNYQKIAEIEFEFFVVEKGCQYWGNAVPLRPPENIPATNQFIMSLNYDVLINSLMIV